MEKFEQRKVVIADYTTMKKWEEQKAYVRERLSNKKTGEIYGKRKIDVEPFFEFLKADLGFTRMSVRGKSKAHNELGFALLAVNLGKFIANNNKITKVS